MSNLNSTQKQNLAALALIAFFLVFNVFSMQEKSLTADEAKHYRYGMSILNLDSDRLRLPSGIYDDSKMPISALNALPARLGEGLPDGSLKDFLGKFFTARLVTVIFSAWVAWLVFLWSRSLYGFVPALVSLSLYVLDPNVIAHSELVTTDIYAAGMIALSLYWLWKFANDRRTRDGLLFVIVLGLSQLAKYTSVALFPLAFAALAAHDWFSPREPGGGARRNAGLPGRLLLYGSIAVVASLVVINIGYLFNQSFMPLKDYHFESQRFQSAQTHVAWLANLPVPTPYAYLQGLDLISFREATGFGYGRIYLLGQLHEFEGFPGYYFVASFFKVPIATQIVLLASLTVYFRDRLRRSRFWRDEIFLLLPVAAFTIYFNFFYNGQLGIRFYLVVFPLLYVFAGHLFQNWRNFTRLRQIGSFVLAGYLAVSVFSYYPDYIPYFNEFVPDRKMAYKYLADSNIDWGQSRYYLQQYLATHANAQYDPNTIKVGRLVVPVNDLVGVTGDPEKYAWLRENFEPADTVAHTYLVYEIHSTDLIRLCEAQSICP